MFNQDLGYLLITSFFSKPLCLIEHHYYKEKLNIDHFEGLPVSKVHVYNLTELGLEQKLTIFSVLMPAMQL